MRRRFFTQNFEVPPAIIIGEKDVLTVVAALCDVVRMIRNNDARETRHDVVYGRNALIFGACAEKMVTVPIFAIFESGAIADQAEAARLGHISRARMTQIMNLLLLAPDIQEQILHLPRTMRCHDPIAEMHLRSIVREPCWGTLRQLWSEPCDPIRTR